MIKPVTMRIDLTAPDNDALGAGTYTPIAKALSELPMIVLRADVYAAPGNSGIVYIGDKRVSAIANAVRGAPLCADFGHTCGGGTRETRTDLSWWYVAADTNGDSVYVLMEIEVP